MTRGTRAAIRILGALLALALGCGDGEPASGPSGPPLAAEPRASEGNRPPEIASVRLEPVDPQPGDLVRARVRAGDPDGDALELGFSWSLDGRRLPVDGPEVDLDGARRDQVLHVRVVASDGQAESAAAVEEVRVANRRPELLGLRMEPASEVARGEPVAVWPEARDPDDDPIDFDYQWTVNDDPVDETGASFATNDLRRGDRIQVRVVARDGDSRSHAVESAVVRVANAPPQIVSRPDAAWVDGTFRYRVEARDPDGDRNLRFRLLEAPEGMRIDPVLGELTWKPEPDQAGVHVVDLAVEDPQGATVAQRFELTVRTSQDEAPAAAAE
jgi:hypothetical protein